MKLKLEPSHWTQQPGPLAPPYPGDDQTTGSLPGKQQQGHFLGPADGDSQPLFIPVLGLLHQPELALSGVF